MSALLLSFLALAAAPQAPTTPPAAAPSPAFGVWQNPRHSIAVRIERCGAEICGVIVGANPEAKQDARDAGVPQLIGVQLLSGYRQVSQDRWEGTVYVPDMGRRFSSHIVQVAPNTLRISGCLIGGWICKSQDWTRL
ncbi:MAG: DUF2147 domain-containing protein [Novosphingobium sp.]|nr:DUF2147 domain-containing protein [Novosphingobium sp.]